MPRGTVTIVSVTVSRITHTHTHVYRLTVAHGRGAWGEAGGGPPDTTRGFLCSLSLRCRKINSPDEHSSLWWYIRSRRTREQFKLHSSAAKLIFNMLVTFTRRKHSNSTEQRRGPRVVAGIVASQSWRRMHLALAQAASSLMSIFCFLSQARINEEYFQFGSGLPP